MNRGELSDQEELNIKRSAPGMRGAKKKINITWKKVNEGVLFTLFPNELTEW